MKSSIPPSAAAPTRRQVVLAATLIVFAGIVAYHNSLAGPFVFDDPSSITTNPTLRRLWPPWAPLMTPRAAVTVQGRPMLNFTLALNHALGGTAVRGYHLANLAIHLAAALALFGLVRRTLLRPVLRARFGAAAWPLALTIAVLWAVHPLQTQAVTYVIQRAESLMGMFYLLTLYCFVRGVEAVTPTRWFGLAVITCLSGMATKEVMVSAPVMVWLYDRTFVAGSFREAWRRRKGFHLRLAGTWLLLACLVTSTGGNRGGAAGFGVGVAWWDYALTQFVAIAHYLRLSLWPAPLIFEYGTFWVDDLGAVFLPALVVASLAAGTALAAWRKPAAGFLGCFFFAILSVTSLVPGTTQMIVEHRMYLPLAAVLVSIVLAVHGLLTSRNAFACVVAVIPFGLLTVARNEDYRGELALWHDTVTKRPGNALAHEMFAQALERAGKPAEAIAERETALRIYPGFAVVHNNLGDILLRQGKISEAIAHYEAALQTKPEYPDAQNGLGSALAQTGRNPEAIAHLTEAVRLNPDFPEAHYNLANALGNADRPADAIAHYAQTLRLAPDMVAARYNLANSLARLGRSDEALRAYEETLRLAPGHANAHYNLANLLVQLDRKADARDHFAAAVRLAPGFVDARANLGSVLLDLGELETARREFEQVLQLDPTSALAHLNLGHVHLLSGRIPEARAAYSRALQLEPNLASAREALRRIETAPAPGR